MTDRTVIRRVGDTVEVTSDGCDVCPVRTVAYDGEIRCRLLPLVTGLYVGLDTGANPVPHWCPLRKGPITLRLKEK